MSDPVSQAIWLMLVTAVVLSGFTWLFVTLAGARDDTWIVGCPPTRVRAVVLVRSHFRGRGGVVVYCSRWATDRRRPCDRPCLPRAA